MTSGLTLQTDREIRYEQRCQRKRIEQQKVDRATRLENRENNKQYGFENKSEIAEEVSKEIFMLSQRRRTSRSRCSNFISFFS
jgi:hypothetical protein